MESKFTLEDVLGTGRRTPRMMAPKIGLLRKVKFKKHYTIYILERSALSGIVPNI